MYNIVFSPTAIKDLEETKLELYEFSMTAETLCKSFSANRINNYKCRIALISSSAFLYKY